MEFRYAHEPAPVIRPASVGCLQPGCPCKDARVLSFRTLRFVKHLAEQRGQTLDRVVRAEPLSSVLLRPVESEDIGSGNVVRLDGKGPVADTCVCGDCRCENLLTLTHPTRCRDCANESHSTARA